MRESLIIEQYISGLGSPELQRHVQFAHPTTLDRAISLAVEFEAFDGAHIYPRKPRDMEEMPVLALRASDGVASKAVDTAENAKISKLEDSLKEVQKSLKHVMEKRNNTPHRNNSGRQPGQRNPRQRRVLQCFQCHEEGHFMRDCPTLQPGNQNPVNQQGGANGHSESNNPLN